MPKGADEGIFEAVVASGRGGEIDPYRLSSVPPPSMRQFGSLLKRAPAVAARPVQFSPFCASMQCMRAKALHLGP
jgi:hypothetical protein